MQASDALAAMALQLQQAAQQQLAAAAVPGLGAATSAPLPGAQTGVVRAWYDEKGFGFITPDSGGQDVFVHRRQLGEGQSLVQGTPVQFEFAMSSSSGKPAASRVTPLGAANPLLALAAATSVAQPAAIAGPASFSSTGFGGKGFGKGAAEPSDNLFICGLPLDTTEDKLKTVFNEYGTITSVRMLPDVAGKPDKSALVRMADVSQASWMVEHLNGNIPQSLSAPITVRFADNRAQKARALGLPKPGTLGAAGYGAAGSFGGGFRGGRSSPYGAPAAAPAAGAGVPGALDPASAGLAGAVDPANAAVLLAALAQIQQQQNGILPAPNSGQSALELLQDLQNMQGLTGASAGSPTGSFA